MSQRQEVDRNIVGTWVLITVVCLIVAAWCAYDGWLNPKTESKTFNKFAAGVFLVTWTLLSAVRTVILPRSAQSLLSRVVFRSVRIVFRGFSALRDSFDWRDRVMALFAPVGMLTLVAAWLTLTTAGFTAVYWGVEQRGWADAFWESGSSLLTLGFAPVEGSVMQAVAFVEAALGLGLLAQQFLHPADRHHGLLDLVDQLAEPHGRAQQEHGIAGERQDVAVAHPAVDYQVAAQQEDAAMTRPVHEFGRVVEGHHQPACAAGVL